MADYTVPIVYTIYIVLYMAHIANDNEHNRSSGTHNKSLFGRLGCQWGEQTKLKQLQGALTGAYNSAMKLILTTTCIN